MKRQSKPTIGPVEFIDRVIKHDEKGEPWNPLFQRFRWRYDGIRGGLNHAA